jgi:site-specific recombinase XerD
LLDRYLCQRHVSDLTAVTPALIEAFLASRHRGPARSYNHLLGVIRCFFGWLVVQERIDQSPVRISPRRTSQRRQPFLFDPPLAERLLALAGALPDRPKGPNRGETYRLIFAMMYTLGMRVGEVSRLRREDVDLDRQLFCVRQTKFAKDRLVPFGPRFGEVLVEYLDNRECRAGRFQPDDPLFSFCAGRPVHPCTITQTFHHLVSGNPAFAPLPGAAAPRLHCLRHSFAVGTLLRWYRAGIDVGQRLIHLSTFLGHSDPESTAWYLTVTAELLDAANERFERFAPPGLRAGYQ